MPLEHQKTSLDEMSASGAPERGTPPITRVGKIARLLLVVICAEVGVVLLLFPWVEFWERNYLSGGALGWHNFWMNRYFRGAVSGLGVVNLYIAFVELLRFLRLWRL